MDFDKLYFERMQTALTATIDGVSTAPVTGTVYVKPIETIAALSTIVGRILGLAEQASGKRVDDAMIDNYRSIVAANLDVVRASFSFAEDVAKQAQPSKDRVADAGRPTDVPVSNGMEAA